MAALTYVATETSRLALLLFAGLAIVCIYRILRIGHRDKRYPPGPPTIPILGNAHQLPTRDAFKQFTKWAEEYGPVFSLKIGSDTMIVLNDRESIHDLVDKRSAIYSGRPADWGVDTAMGKQTFALVDPLDQEAPGVWKEHRRIASQNFSPKQLDEKVAPIQEAEIAQCINDILEKPDDFFDHIRRTTASVGNMYIFGFRAKSFQDGWGNNVYRVTEYVSRAIELGAVPPINQFPILKLIPTSLAPWKQRAYTCLSATSAIWLDAINAVIARRALGDKRLSLADRILSQEVKLLGDKEGNGRGDEMMKKAVEKGDMTRLANMLGSINIGAADTTASATCSSIRLLAKFPEVQRRAQEEIDRVCGDGRMPVWDDFADLPYINCIVKEGLRFSPVLPLAITHRLSQPDTYKSFLLPSNASIVLNVWGVQRSTKLANFSDANTYNPDRFLNHPKLAMDYAGSPDYSNRDHYAYGSGRRICVGIHLAERSQWRLIAKLLWAFSIEEIDGEELNVDDKCEGAVLFPNPYKVRFRVRGGDGGEKRREVIKRMVEDGRDVLKGWE